MSDRVLLQRTLKNSIHCSGIGLHTGERISMTLHPAAPETGVVFRRTDLRGLELPARWDTAVETPLCTTIADDNGVRIATIEHLMSALAGCDIDNALIEMDGPEVPAMDGSAAPFVFLIECAGTVEQDAPRRILEVRKEITVSDSEPHRSASLSPGQGLRVDFEIDFDHPTVSRQEWSVRLAGETYKREVARARTFGFLHEVDRLRAMGLALGGSLDNAIVIARDGIMNDGGLRYDNEFVRHKVLDLIGDLYLVGAPMAARARGVRAGHALTLRLLQALFADAGAWRWRAMTSADLEAAAGASVPPARAVAAPA